MEGLHITLSDELVRQVLEAVAAREIKAHLQALPPPDEWLTIPQAAKLAQMTEGHMRLLVLGRPYRAASGDRPERQAFMPRIPRGDTGFAKGARIRRSDLDHYLLNRHKYRQK